MKGSMDHHNRGWEDVMQGNKRAKSGRNHKGAENRMFGMRPAESRFGIYAPHHALAERALPAPIPTRQHADSMGSQGRRNCRTVQVRPSAAPHNRFGSRVDIKTQVNTLQMLLNSARADLEGERNFLVRHSLMKPRKNLAFFL